MKWRNDIENWLQWVGAQRATFDDVESWWLLATVLEMEDALHWLDRMTSRGMTQPDYFRGRYS